MAEPPPTDAEGTAERLVLAMPRRELFAISGFTTRIDWRVIESLADESWYAQERTLVGNLDAKQVRLGLVATRGPVGAEQVLISDAGELLHTTPILPEAQRLAPGVGAWRALAQLAATRWLDDERCRVELCGYCNEDALPAIRDQFILVYRCRAGVDGPAPAGLSWVPRRDLGALALEPASALVAAGLFS